MKYQGQEEPIFSKLKLFAQDRRPSPTGQSTTKMIEDKIGPQVHSKRDFINLRSNVDKKGAQWLLKGNLLYL